MIHSRYLRWGIPGYKLVDYDEEAIQSELQRESKQNMLKVDKNLNATKVRVSLKCLCFGWVTLKSSTAGSKKLIFRTYKRSQVVFCKVIVKSIIMDRKSCPVCHRSYSRSDALKRHFEVAHRHVL